MREAVVDKGRDGVVTRGSSVCHAESLQYNSTVQYVDLDRRRAVCALYEQSLHIAVLYPPPEEGASLGGTCLFKGGESWGRDSATGGQLPTLLIP